MQATSWQKGSGRTAVSWTKYELYAVEAQNIFSELRAFVGFYVHFITSSSATRAKFMARSREAGAVGGKSDRVCSACSAAFDSRETPRETCV